MNQSGAARRGRFVHLRAVTDADVGFVFYLGVVDDNLVRWRLRGRTVSPASFQQFLWSNTDQQFLICLNDDDQPIGHCCTYQTDEYARTTHFAIVLAPDFQGVGWALEGAYLMFNYLFDSFPLENIYFEVPEFNAPQLASLCGDLLVEEGRRVGAVYGMGGFCDLLYLTLRRERWSDERHSSLARLFSAGRSGA